MPRIPIPWYVCIIIYVGYMSITYYVIRSSICKYVEVIFLFTPPFLNACRMLRAYISFYFLPYFVRTM